MTKFLDQIGGYLHEHPFDVMVIATLVFLTATVSILVYREPKR